MLTRHGLEIMQEISFVYCFLLEYKAVLGSIMRFPLRFINYYQTVYWCTYLKYRMIGNFHPKYRQSFSQFKIGIK